jgi:ribosomal protein S18 acetylase RimI-like enzyme
VLGLRVAGPEVADRTADIRVRTVGPGELEEWTDAVASGHAHTDEGDPASHESFAREAIERVVRDLAEIDDFGRYAAYRDGAIAGGASMRVDGRIAQLTGAATLPGHRRRGVQTALTHARLADARRDGCDLVTVTTLPGSRSEESMLRLGFSILYTRAVLRTL